MLEKPIVNHPAIVYVCFSSHHNFQHIIRIKKIAAKGPMWKAGSME